MNEQEFADLFSEQLDHMLQGETSDSLPDADDLHELLDLSQHLAESHFQPTPAAETTFQNQLAQWAGLTTGGSSMAIFGLSKFWIISIIVVSFTIFAGGGFILGSMTNVTVYGAIGQLPETATATTTATALPTETATTEASAVPSETATPLSTPSTTATPVETATETLTPQQTSTPTSIPTETTTGTATPEPTSTITMTATPTPTTVATALPSPSPTPTVPPGSGSTTSSLSSLIFVSNLVVPNLCSGVYSVQTSLVHQGSGPVDNAGLVWEVIVGTEFVSQVSVNSSQIIQLADDDSESDELTNATQISHSSVEISTTTTILQQGYGYLNEITVGQTVDFDIDVEVNESWWHQPDGTQIQVALTVANQTSIDQFFTTENQEYSYYGEVSSSVSQVITLVKQGSQWVTLNGAAHYYQEQSLLVDGSVIELGPCSWIPEILPPGSNVEVIGILQPNGTFIAISIVVININVYIGDFDSGALSYDGDSGSYGSKGSKKQSDKCKSKSKKSSCKKKGS